MARYTGKDGIVKFTDTALAQVRSWSLDRTGDTVEDTVIGVDDRTYKATVNSASGSLELYYDPEDTGAQVGPGDTIAVSLFPAGEVSGDPQFDFEAIVTGVPLAGSFDGMIEQTISYQVTGPITESTVTP